jgi:hypothetical protein
VAAAIGVGATIAARPAPAVRPVPQRLAYTRLPAACDLISTAHLVKYLPGATGHPERATSNGTLRGGGCLWSSDNVNLGIQATLFDSAEGNTEARQDYRESVGPDCGCQRGTVTSLAVPGLGDQATAQFMAGPPAAGLPWTAPTVTLVAWSGNAVVVLTYLVMPPIGEPAPPRPTNAALLAQAVTMARDVLAGLAKPAAVAAVPLAIPSPTPTGVGPVYTSATHPCRLIKSATIARYVPDASASTLPYPADAHTSSCTWNGSDGDIIMSVALNPDWGSAEELYDISVSNDKHDSAGTTFDGAEPVKGLGQKATVVFQTYSQDLPGVDLEVWSGNAVIDVNFSDALYGPSLGRATKLAGAIAMVRDVLAGLPT